jgi:long-chain acyl-CoA synthetase
MVGLDPSRYGAPRIAPCVVFDDLAAKASRVRFMVDDGRGDWEAVTWGGFAARIRGVALFLQENGLRPGESAVLFAHNSVDWIAAALGIQAVGGVMVPIYPVSTADQARYILDHCEARFVFCDEGTLAAVPSGRVVVGLDGCGDLPLPAVLEQGAALHAARPDRMAEQLATLTLEQPALMLYTSGTTGAPKGVPLTHLNIGVNARDWLLSNGPMLAEELVDLLWLPMSHIFGFGQVCLGNTLRFTSYLCEPKRALELMPVVRPQVFMSVPAFWEKLAAGAASEATAVGRCEKLVGLTGGKLRFCLSGGAGLSRDVKEAFLAAGMLIIEGYGLTETSPTLTLNRPDDYHFESVGKPLPTVQLQLAEDGEILAQGPNVFAGYHKDPQATRAAFTQDGWFRTGDLGEFTPDGFLKIVGRKKEILVTAGGKNIPPANVEMRFADDPLIDRVVVYGDGKRYLVAGVWPTATDVDTASVQKRIDAVNAELARHETIKRFALVREPLTVEGGHLTTTLKLRRRAVYEAFHDVFEGLYRA